MCDSPSHHQVACTVVAALLHLCFMAAFSWMLVEGLLLWSKVVAVNLSEDRHMKYYYLIGWGKGSTPTQAQCFPLKHFLN